MLKSKLGEGASGVVYRAYDPALDRDVAIKLAKTESLTPEQVKHIVAEFYHEARIAGKYSHENIVTIYDVISDGTYDYIVMEFVPGRSVLDYMITTGPLNVDEALFVTYKCCLGLAYVHYHGVIHRDIKPGNIMYHPSQGVVKLMDFSIANNIEDPPVKDNGTIAYMAPEHFDPGRNITLLTDVFALGSSLYRLLTGTYPFTKENTVQQILHQAPTPVNELRPDIPREVSDLVNKAMAKADADRFQSAAKFAKEIESALHHLYPESRLTISSSRYREM
ncbi:MAG: serine/threonine-protein kinase [Chloroflexota bacterium]